MNGSRLRLRMPSPAMVVALGALFVALGGTGYAMTQLPSNSVGTTQLKNNAVTTAKVKNGTLVAGDFKAGTLKAGPPGPAGPAGPKGDTGPAGTGAALALGTALSDSPRTTNSTSLSTLGSATIEVPTGSTSTVVATFSAESLCTGGTGKCVARLFIDGNEMNPEDGNNFIFDSPAAAASTFLDYNAHSVTRLRKDIGAGSHTVAVQIQTTSASTSFRLDDWTIIAVAYKQ